MKKIMSLLLVFVVLLAGCGSGSSSDADVVTELTEPVTIEFWHAMSGQMEETLNSIVDDFNSSQDMITVKAVNQGSYSDLDTKLQSAGQAGNLPALAQGYPNSIYEYIQNGWVTELTPYTETADFGMDVSDFIPAYLDEDKDADGNLWAVPFNKSTEALFYNQEMLDKAGVEVPTTPQELLDTSKAIYDATGKPGLGFDSLANTLATIMYNEGITSWQEDGEFNFNDPKVVKAVTTLQTAVNDGYIRTAGEDQYMSGPFANGDVGMFIGSTAGASFVESGVNGKFDWSVASYPTDHVIQQGTSVAMFNSTPEEQSAAFQFMTYLTSTEVMTKWALETGYLPATTSSLESAEYQASLEKNPAAKAAADQVDKMALLIPVFGGSQEINSVDMNDTMKTILEGNGDVQTELDKLNDDAAQIYSRNN